ncbi:hypothetical protein F9802_06640 [Bacillus aerolatus]|uniref:Uncharacterized protein n=1 Tax=Bacillus aerolatus TaxID=2653354 RepID=A0A6I1FGV3_9BACI|nr:hypothetical protein [Bacillus aerolatus]KAB7707425.1 hypothetical protein F9802_06640 [Bacillus aerolatus]
MSDFKVHHIHEQVVITANHNKDGSVKYHVCYGEVDWKKDGNKRPAVFILMSYKGRINYQSPAHLTLDAEEETDFEKVYKALTYLKMKYIVNKKYEVRSNHEVSSNS